MKYDPLKPGPSNPPFTDRGFTCYVSSKKYMMGRLVVGAVSAAGREIARTEEPFVLEDDGSRPIKFTFERTLDLARVAAYTIDLKPY